ncbi:MAG: hypothetical protein IJB85_05275 [Clostridia bacterium]|nr:hypothetical protein [Clostridia bacterium]
MNIKIGKWIRPALFTLGGALAGLAYYRFIGCATGSCPITSNPVGSMLYMALIGWLVSGMFGKDCGACRL